MSYLFEQADKAFRDDQIRELGQDPEGLRFLKLRSLSRKNYMERLFEICQLVLPSSQSKYWLKYLYENSEVTDDLIDKTINNIFQEERKTRKQVEDKLISELYKVDSFDWGGLHQNSLEKTIVDNYVKKIQCYDELNDSIENELHQSMRAYVLSSWFNHWTSIIIEDLFKDHPHVIPAVGRIKKVDFFVNNVPYDLKVTYLPEGYIKDQRKIWGLPVETTELKKFCRGDGIHFDATMSESKLLPDLWMKVSDHPSFEASELINDLKSVRTGILEDAKNEPEILARWLYENQGYRRFDASNRLYLVLVDLNNFFESWKLKRAKSLLIEKIHTHLNNTNGQPGFDLQFDWEGRNYSATCDIIFITHKR